MSDASALRQLAERVTQLCDAADHIIVAHDPKGPCFENLKNSALVARQSLALYVQRN